MDRFQAGPLQGRMASGARGSPSPRKHRSRRHAQAVVAGPQLGLAKPLHVPSSHGDS